MYTESWESTREAFEWHKAKTRNFLDKNKTKVLVLNILVLE